MPWLSSAPAKRENQPHWATSSKGQRVGGNETKEGGDEGLEWTEEF